MVENKNESIGTIMSNDVDWILTTKASENPTNRFSTPSLIDSENTFFPQSNYVFGEEKSKTIEKLEEELVSEKRSTRSANEQYESEKEETDSLRKKYTKLEKRNKKITRERDNLEFDLKILKDVNRNLLHRLNNS